MVAAFQTTKNPHFWVHAFPAQRVFFVLLGCCAVTVLLVSGLILSAPNEPTMGFVQRIFYFHVPCAWVALLGALVAGVAGIVFLFHRSDAADRVVVAATELVILFGLCVLITGPLWAKRAWGTFWQWDVRLTTTLLLWIVFVVAHLARVYAGPDGSRLAAGLAVFALVDVPLIYVSVSWWRHQHPKNTVVRTLDPAMRPAFWISMLAITMVFALLFWFRQRLERQSREVQCLLASQGEDEV